MTKMEKLIIEGKIEESRMNDAAWKIYENSDKYGFADLFGSCESYEELNSMASAWAEELFEEV